MMISIFIGLGVAGVLPKPAHVTNAGTTLALSPTFSFAATGVDSDTLQGAFQRYTTIIADGASSISGAAHADLRSLSHLRSSGLLSEEEFASFRARVDGHAKVEGVATTSDAALVGCDVKVAHNDTVKTLATDESYTLTIAAPRCTIDAPTVYGAMYADSRQHGHLS